MIRVNPQVIECRIEHYELFLEAVIISKVHNNQVMDGSSRQPASIATSNKLSHRTRSAGERRRMEASAAKQSLNFIASNKHVHLIDATNERRLLQRAKSSFQWLLQQEAMPAETKSAGERRLLQRASRRHRFFSNKLVPPKTKSECFSEPSLHFRWLLQQALARRGRRAAKKIAIASSLIVILDGFSNKLFAEGRRLPMKEEELMLQPAQSLSLMAC
jgi:hypothetical protein